MSKPSAIKPSMTPSGCRRLVALRGSGNCPKASRKLLSWFTLSGLCAPPPSLWAPRQAVGNSGAHSNTYAWTQSVAL